MELNLHSPNTYDCQDLVGRVMAVVMGYDGIGSKTLVLH